MPRGITQHRNIAMAGGKYLASIRRQSVNADVPHPEEKPGQGGIIIQSIVCAILSLISFALYIHIAQRYLLLYGYKRWLSLTAKKALTIMKAARLCGL